MHAWTILLVDDEPHLTQSLQRALRKEPYVIRASNSPQEALELLDRESIDLVISDERMPDMSGTDFLALVRRRYPQTVRMMLTGHASLEAAIRAINEGEVYRFFVKPCNPVVLKVAICQALQMQELERQARRLLQEYRRTAGILETLERNNPGILRTPVDASGTIVVEDVMDLDELLAEIEMHIPKSHTTRQREGHS